MRTHEPSSCVHLFFCTVFISQANVRFMHPFVQRSICLSHRVSNLLVEHGSAELCVFSSVGEWLDAIKMGRYTELFMESGYTSLDVVTQMTLE